MNGSTGNLTGGNYSTVYESFWPCFLWHTENNTEYDLAVAACSHLPNPFLDENKKVGIASAAVGTVALLTNLVVLSGVLKNYELSKPMYMFVANLAVADCVAGLFSFFFCASVQLELFSPWTMMGVYCTYFLVLVSSAVGVVLLSMDRYLAILHPIFYQTRMSGRHVAVSLGIAWPACVLVCLSPLMGWNCGNTDTESCLTFLPEGYPILINTILLTAVVIVVFVNIRIFIQLKQRFSRLGPPENPRDDLPAARRREQRVAERQYEQLQMVWKMQVTVVIISAVFIIFWLPICVGSVRVLLCSASEDCEVEAKPFWGFLIALCNSAINPVIYALRIKKIREAAHRRARRLATAVREKLGRSSNQVVNIQIIGGAGTMNAVAGPNTDNRTDQLPKWAVSRRANLRNAPSSSRVGDAGIMDAVAGPSTDNRTDQLPKWAVSRRANLRNAPSSSRVGDSRAMDAVAGPSTDNRTDQLPKWAVSRRANLRNAPSSSRVGDSRAMDAVAGPSTDNRTDQLPKWAVSRRANLRNAPSSSRVGDSRAMDAVAGPSTDNRTDQPPKWAVSRRANLRNALRSNRVEVSRDMDAVAGPSTDTWAGPRNAPCPRHLNVLFSASPRSVKIPGLDVSSSEEDTD